MITMMLIRVAKMFTFGGLNAYVLNCLHKFLSAIGSQNLVEYSVIK